MFVALPGLFSYLVLTFLAKHEMSKPFARRQFPCNIKVYFSGKRGQNVNNLLLCSRYFQWGEGGGEWGHI